MGEKKPGLEIRLLGPPEFRRGGRVLPPLATRKTQSLLAYLILHRDRPHSRDELATLFWADRGDIRARRSLATALWRIRRLLADDDHLLADSASVQFNPASHFWLDLAEFEKLVISRQSSAVSEQSVIRHGLSVCNLQSAIELYRGDLLEGFYDDWCIEERYRLEEIYLQALGALVAAHAALGQSEEALRYAGLLLTRDPLREDMHCTAVRLNVQLGNRVEAVRQARWCRAVLQAELGTEPSPETVAVYDGLLGASWRREPVGEMPTPHRPPPRSQAALLLERPPFVGRETEWGMLLTRWEQARSGRGSLMLVSGEAGIGKSRLVEELLQYVWQRGGWSAEGHCYEYERAMPHGPLADLVRASLSAAGAPVLERVPVWQMAELSRLLPELGERLSSPPQQHVEANQEQARLFDALTLFLLDLARKNPLLLALEDIHWASDSTLVWLHYLARRLPKASILLLVTCRSEEISSDHPLYRLMLQLEQKGLAARLELTRLPQAALARWIAGASESFVAHLYRQTEGNPFFALETLRALLDDGRLQPAGWGWVGESFDWAQADLPIPTSVSQIIRMRLERLSTSAREAGVIAAVIGRAFDLDVLTETLGWSEEVTLTALDELLRRRLIREASGPSGEDYEFDHHLVQEVIYQGLHYRQRRRLHRLVGQAMEQVYADRSGVAGELAYHFEQALEKTRALQYLLQAGHDAAALFAHDEALGYWKRAFSILAGLTPSAAAAFQESISNALIARAELYHLRGCVEEREADLRRLRQLAEQAGDAQLLDQALIREAHYLNLDGKYDQAIERAREAALRSRQRGDADGESRALAELGFAYYFRGEYQAAMEQLQAALALEQVAPAVRGEVLSVLSYAHYLVADYQRSLDYRQQAFSIRSASGQQARVAEDLTDIGILYTRLNQLSLAERYLLDALKLAREIGSQPAESYSLNHLGELQYLRGDYPEALKFYTDSLALQRATGSRRGEASVLCNAGMTFEALGDYAVAETMLRQSLAIEEEIGYESGLSETLARLALVLANVGRHEEALDVVTRSLAIARRINDRYCQVLGLNLLARLRLAEGEPVSAVTLAQESVALAQEINLSSGIIVGLALLGLAHLALGDAQKAVQYSAQAVTLLREQGWIEGPEEEIYLAHYQIMAALGEKDEAASALQQAHAELMSKAERLKDEPMRRRFLEEVPINCQIMAASLTSLPPAPFPPPDGLR